MFEEIVLTVRLNGCILKKFTQQSPLKLIDNNSNISITTPQPHMKHEKRGGNFGTLTYSLDIWSIGNVKHDQ